MRARTQVYREARRLQVVQLILTVAVPFFLGLVGVFVSAVRPYAGAASVLLTIFDVAWFDREQRTKLRLAARISEEFDTGVLELPWNTFIGPKAEPEVVERASHAWVEGDTKLRDWYPPNVSKTSITLGRILCQRSNLRYDCELRRRYGNVLLGIAAATVLALIVIGVVQNLTLVDLVVTTFAPAGPILLWAVRERFRQRDTGLTDETMRGGVDKLWDETSSGHIGHEASASNSRILQDAIFAHRSSSPLIFPFIYPLMRNKLEREMHAGADELLRRIGVT